MESVLATLFMLAFGTDDLGWQAARDRNDPAAWPSLPWNGAAVVLFALSGGSYQKSCLRVAVETVILPLRFLIPVFIYYNVVY